MSTPSFQILPALPTDAPRMSELTLAAIRAFAVSLDLSGTEQFVAYAQATAYQERMTQARFFYQCAVLDSQVIGFIGVLELRHLQNLYVDSRYRGQGIASALWQSALAHCTSNGTQALTVRSSDAAVDIYKHWGFVQTEPRQAGGGVWFTPMRFELSH